MIKILTDSLEKILENLKENFKKTMNTTQASGDYNQQKHLEFLGLSYNPFPVAPDNTDFYLSQHNDTVITKLTQAIFSRKGFMLLTGEIGLGKTTMSRRIIHMLERRRVETSLILQSFFQGENLLKEIISDFGIVIKDTKADISTLMTALNDFLLEKNKADINCAILIDDAQNLSIESLELVRMISNLEADREKLVQILLVGQPELMDKLNSYELRQLKSRVAITQHPIALKKIEMGKYIQFKLNMAGDSGKIIIKNNVLQKLYKLSAGNLRKINILMDQALHEAFLNNTYIIKLKFIEKANKDLAFDIPVRKSADFNSMLVLLLLILIIFGIGGGSTFFYYNSDKGKTTTSQKNITIAKKPAVTATLSENKDSNVKTMALKTSLTKDSPSASVVSFLSVYGLKPFSIQFQQALNQKNFNNIQDIIFDQTGFQLVKLTTISNPVRKKYDILSSIDPNTQTPAFYLFWKPRLRILNFYSGYLGKEITDLQRLMYEVRLYDFNIDGIVGQRIMKSVIEFQKQNNLPVTGFPDPETIFILANMDR